MIGRESPGNITPRIGKVRISFCIWLVNWTVSRQKLGRQIHTVTTRMCGTYALPAHTYAAPGSQLAAALFLECRVHPIKQFVQRFRLSVVRK
jgi:hypothetical protein